MYTAQEEWLEDILAEYNSRCFQSASIIPDNTIETTMTWVRIKRNLKYQIVKNKAIGGLIWKN